MTILLHSTCEEDRQTDIHEDHTVEDHQSFVEESWGVRDLWKEIEVMKCRPQVPVGGVKF